MTNFLFGFLYPFKCIKFFFSHPVLIRYSIVPMIINLVIYGTIFILSFKWLIGFSSKLTNAETGINQPLSEFLHIMIIIAGFIIILIVCYLIFTVLGGLVTAPFNENISQKVEEIIASNIDKPVIGFWKDAWLSIIGEAQKTIFYFLFLFLIFLLNLLPLIGSVLSGVIGLLFSFYYNALDFLDYPLTRRLASFKTKLKAVNKGGMISYGFGCMAFLMMLLPVINVFMKPVLVVAGTSLYFEKIIQNINN